MARDKNKQKPLPSSISYFERLIVGHNAIRTLDLIKENVYKIERHRGLPSLKILVADIYVVSEADVFEICAEHPELDCIILIGYYNKYSGSAKSRATENNVGLFDMREVFGALNFTDDKFLYYELKKKDI